LNGLKGVWYVWHEKPQLLCYRSSKPRTPERPFGLETAKVKGRL